MTVASATRETRGVGGLGRLIVALPLLALFACAAAVYAWQGSRLVTPWTYYDELLYADLARAVAGTTSRLGAGSLASSPHLYPIVIAPAWLFRTETAYELTKIIGALLMPAALFPVFFLARTVVSRPLALFAAAGAVAVPALTYSSEIMEEALAYPYAALTFFLIARALATRRRSWIAAAVVACVVAPLVRRELAVLPLVFALAAGLYAATTEAARQRWSEMQPRSKAGLIAATGVLLVVVGWLARYVSAQWADALHDPPAGMAGMIHAAGVVAVGVGFVPAVAGLALVLGRLDQLPSRRGHAFLCLLTAGVTTFLAYTAVKTAFLASIHFDNPVTERNLIYLVPLLFVATAVWLELRPGSIVALLGAAAVVAGVVSSIPMRFPAFPASSAPSFAVLSKVHSWGIWPDGIRAALVAAVVIATLALLAVRRQWRNVGVASLCAVVVAWAFASEVAASSAAASYSRFTIASLPRPLDWLGEATHGRETIYVGQQVTQRIAVVNLAFWNASLAGLFTLDHAPLGGFTRIALGRSGKPPFAGTARFVLADYGVTPVGRLVERRGAWRLYSVQRPVRIASAEVGVYADRWIGSDASFRRYVGAPGTVRVTLSRCVPAGAVRATIIARPVLARGRPGGITAVRRIELRSCAPRTVAFPAAPPFQVHVHVQPTFVPARTLAHSTDTRRLGAQPRFSFQPR